MAFATAPARLPAPPSTVTGELYQYLVQIRDAVNALPVISYTSYDGGPNSNLTGAPGDVCVNVVTSAQTKRLYIKELGSGNTGWVSFSTIP